MSDGAELCAAYTKNRLHLQHWEPTRSEAFHTAAGQQEEIGASLHEQAKGRGYFWVLVTGTRIVGRISLNGVVAGAFLSGNLGYWVANDQQGRGLASKASAAVCRIALTQHGLHRIQAATLAENLASQRVLERCSFTRIGFAPQYLRINGRWQDHLLFQRILLD